MLLCWLLWPIRPNCIKLGTTGKKLRFFLNPILCKFFRVMAVMLGGVKIKHLKKCNSLPNLLKLIKFWGIVQKYELHKIFDNFYERWYPSSTLASKFFEFIFAYQWVLGAIGSVATFEARWKNVILVASVLGVVEIAVVFIIFHRSPGSTFFPRVTLITLRRKKNRHYFIQRLILPVNWEKENRGKKNDVTQVISLSNFLCPILIKVRKFFPSLVFLFHRVKKAGETIFRIREVDGATNDTFFFSETLREEWR